MDGQLVDNTTNSELWQGHVPDHVSVIAVKCYHQYSYPRGGVIASLSNGFVTDSFWRCSSVEEDDWFSVDYNDTSWETALLLPVNTIAGRNQLPSSARGVWARGNGYYTAGSTTYCRGRPSINRLRFFKNMV